MTWQQHNVNCCEVHRIPMNKTCGDDASRTSALTNGSQGLQTSAWVPNYHFYGISHKFCKLISCFTSPPINHIVFFCFCWIPVVSKPQVISGGGGGGGVHTPCTLPLDLPLGHYCYVSFWTRDHHITWSFEPHKGLAVRRAEQAPSCRSYFKTLSIGPTPGIEPATSISAVKCSTDWANPATKHLLTLYGVFLSFMTS